MAARHGRRTFSAAALGTIAALSLATGCGDKGCACSWFAKAKPAPPKTYMGVEVLSEGSDPRVTLKVARWSGLRYRVVLEASGSLALEGAPPMYGPTTTMVVDNEVLRGSADPLVERQLGGLVSLIEERAVLRSISISQPGVPQQVLDFWNAFLLPLRGTSNVQHVAESAEVARLSSEMLGGVRPPEAVTKAVDQALEGQRHFPFRLPPTPVGVGARWRFREALDINGAHGGQIAEMTLQSVDANQALVSIAIRQDAPRQSIPHPLIPGASAVLEQFRADGGGELVVDRLTAIVMRGRISVTARSTVSADTAGRHDVATLIGASTIQMNASMLGDEDAGRPGLEPVALPIPPPPAPPASASAH